MYSKRAEQANTHSKLSEVGFYYNDKVPGFKEPDCLAQFLLGYCNQTILVSPIIVRVGVCVCARLCGPKHRTLPKYLYPRRQAIDVSSPPTPPFSQTEGGTWNGAEQASVIALLEEAGDRLPRDIVVNVVGYCEGHWSGRAYLDSTHLYLDSTPK